MAPSAREVAILIPGQGAQHSRMAVGLYGREPVFTETVDTVLDLFGDAAGLRSSWLADHPDVPIDHVTRAQPLLFTLGYALGRMVLHWGVEPAALLGHSVGELVAATLSGVFGLQDAVAVMRDRVARLAEAPPGGMLTVSATEAEVRAVATHHPLVSVGAVNAPRQVVLAGFDGPLRAAELDLRDRGFTVRRVGALTAFHHEGLQAWSAGSDVLAGRVLGAPRIPLWSAFGARLLDERTARDPALWANQAAEPVLFWQALDKLLAAGRYHLVDLGPGQSLAMIARRHRSVRRGESTVSALLPARAENPHDDLLSATAWARRLGEEGYALRPALGDAGSHKPAA